MAVRPLENVIVLWEGDARSLRRMSGVAILVPFSVSNHKRADRLFSALVSELTGRTYEPVLLSRLATPKPRAITLGRKKVMEIKHVFVLSEDEATALDYALDCGQKNMESEPYPPIAVELFKQLRRDLLGPVWHPD